MDQRKLMDNANTITDMAKTQNTVYEIVSDMSSRQDAVEERLSSLEDKVQALQDQMERTLDALPELLTRCLTQHQERIDQRRNFLHPDTAASSTTILPTPTIPSPIFIPHSRSEPSATTPSYQWPTSPILPPISSRTPHLVPVTFNPHGTSSSSSSSAPAATTTTASTTTTAAATTSGTTASNSSNVITNSYTHRQQSS